MMTTKIPMVHYWDGQPLSKLPRKQLEQALVDTHQQLQEARTRATIYQCENIGLMSRVGQLSRKLERRWF